MLWSRVLCWRSCDSWSDWNQSIRHFLWVTSEHDEQGLTKSLASLYEPKTGASELSPRQKVQIWPDIVVRGGWQ